MFAWTAAVREDWIGKVAKGMRRKRMPGDLECMHKC